jgi:hypothetical protein
MRFHQGKFSAIIKFANLNVGKACTVWRDSVEIVPTTVLWRDPIHRATADAASVDMPIRSRHVDVFPVRIEHMIIVQFGKALEIDTG